MRNRQSAVLRTGQNIQQFLDDNAAVVGASIAPARRNLDDAVAQLASMASAQAHNTISSKGATVRQRVLRGTLCNHYMTPLATVAKLVIPDVPDIDVFSVKTKKLDNTQLVAAARGMADAAAQYADVFTQHGLPDDFSAQLRGAANALTTALGDRQAAVAATSGAVSGMLDQERRLRNLLRLINALVIPKLGSNATLLAKWKVARSITRKSNISIVPSSVAGGTSANTGVPA